jgi:hypothetical protein
MNLKNKYILLPFLSLGFILTSCNSFLNELPDNRMELKSPTDVKDLLVSAYSTRNPAYLLEMYSDNTDDYDVTGWTAYDLFQTQAYQWSDITDISNEESPQLLWNSYYSAIETANEALKYINSVPADSTDLSASKGEALLCRAYGEFMLGNVFCQAYDANTASNYQGIPYPMLPETKVGQQYARGTLKELYDKINADIEMGLPLVTDNYSTPKYHFNRNAAYAFAAQFNLYYGNYDKAIAYANHVLGANATSTLRDWKTWYALSVNGQVAPNAYINSDNKANLMLQSVYSMWDVIYGPYSAGNKYAHGSLIAGTEDIQASGPWGASSQFGYTVWHNSSLSKYFINKIPYSFEYTDQAANIGYAHSQYAVFTTDNTLMVRAEAEVLNKDYNAALTDINTELSAMSGSKFSVTLDGIKSFYSNLKYYTPTAPTPKKKLNPTFIALDPITQEPMIQTILQLRRILTLGEGQRLQDIKRYGIVIYRRTLDRSSHVEAVTDSMAVNDPRRAIQLPQDVISAGLEGNPRIK